jgi:hypothetical protein
MERQSYDLNTKPELKAITASNVHQSPDTMNTDAIIAELDSASVPDINPPAPVTSIVHHQTPPACPRRAAESRDSI